MAMSPLTGAHPEWNADGVRRLPDDGGRYEVVDGVLLVSAAPEGRH